MWLAIFLAFVVLEVLVVSLYQNSQLIYQELNTFRRRADNMLNVGDLRKLHREVAAFSRERCWHSQHTSQAEKVMSYIQRKISVMQLGAE
jgi:hypothetical protein